MTKLINTSRIPLNFFVDDNFPGMGNLIRMYMTDALTVSIREVVDGDISPVQWAHNVVKNDFEKVFEFFYVDVIPRPKFTLKYYHNLKKKSSRFILPYESFAFDQLVTIACIFRQKVLHEFSEADLCRSPSEDNSTYASALVYHLLLNDTRFDHTMYSGITSYNRIAEFYITSFEITSKRINRSFLMRFAETIGDFEDDVWVLYDPLWSKALLNNRDRLQCFRKFIFVALIYSTTPVDVIQQMYETDVKHIESDMCEFMELRESKDTEYEDVLEFLLRIERHNISSIIPAFLATLYESNFIYFEQAFRDHFRRHDQKALSIHIDPIRNIINSLENTLDLEWAPNLIIEADNTPTEMVEYLSQNFLDAIISGPVFNHYITIGVAIPEKIDYSDYLFIGSIKDYLYLAAIYTRYEALEPGSGFQNVIMTCHTLLARDDLSLGLSIISLVLPKHIKTNYNSLSAYDLNVLNKLQQAVERITLAYPGFMDDHWKQLLTNVNILINFKKMFLFTIESLYLSNDNAYQTYFKMTKSEWFDKITEFTILLNSSPDKQNVIEFFSKISFPTSSVFLDDRTAIIWTGPMSDLEENV